MSKKPKKSKGRKGSQPAKKQTTAQQKRAERAIAKKIERQVGSKNIAMKAAELINKGESKGVAKSAAELISNKGYKTKTALAAVGNGKANVAQMHAERVESISAKLLHSTKTNRAELQQMIDEEFPGARFTSDALAELIAQGRYEEYIEEMHRDLHTYERILWDRADAARENLAPDADRIVEKAQRFTQLLENL